MIEKKNYSGNPDPDVGGETEFKRCNFSQQEPVADGETFVGVRLFPGDDTPRFFQNCNLVNCEVPPGSVCVKCNTTIRRNNVETSTDALVIDGVSIPITFYSDIIYGIRTGVGEYNYFAEPTVIPLEAE